MLEIFFAIHAPYIETSGDSLWVVQQFHDLLIFRRITYSLSSFMSRYNCLSWDTLLILLCLGMKFNELARKHLATVLIVVYCIFPMSRCFVSPIRVRPDRGKPLRPCTNGNSNADNRKKLIVDYMKKSYKRVSMTVRRVAFKYTLMVMTFIAKWLVLFFRDTWMKDF